MVERAFTGWVFADSSAFIPGSCALSAGQLESLRRSLSSLVPEQELAIMTGFPRRKCFQGFVVVLAAVAALWIHTPAFAGPEDNQDAKEHARHGSSGDQERNSSSNNGGVSFGL